MYQRDLEDVLADHTIDMINDPETSQGKIDMLYQAYGSLNQRQQLEAMICHFAGYRWDQMHHNRQLVNYCFDRWTEKGKFRLLTFGRRCACNQGRLYDGDPSYNIEHHIIKWNFYIQNLDNGNILRTGSICVKNWAAENFGGKYTLLVTTIAEAQKEVINSTNREKKGPCTHQCPKCDSKYNKNHCYKCHVTLDKCPECGVDIWRTWGRCEPCKIKAERRRQDLGKFKRILKSRKEEEAERKRKERDYKLCANHFMDQRRKIHQQNKEGEPKRKCQIYHQCILILIK